MSQVISPIILLFLFFFFSIKESAQASAIQYPVGLEQYGVNRPLSVTSEPLLPLPTDKKSGWDNLSRELKSYYLAKNELLAIPTGEHVADPVKNVQERCIEKEWKAERCFVYRGYDKNEPDIGPYYEDLPSKVGFKIFEKAFNSKFNPKVKKYPDMVGDAATNKEKIISMLKVKMSGLSLCQQVCLLKCASSSMLSSNDHLANRRVPTQELYSQGAGMCTEFTKLAIDIGKELGFEVKDASRNSEHTFLKIKLADEWYFTDPSTTHCNFYPAFKKEHYLGELRQEGRGVAPSDKTVNNTQVDFFDLLNDPDQYEKIEKRLGNVRGK